MSWDNVDNKHKKRFDANFVSCSEDYEINYLVKVIREEFPNKSEASIRSAIAACCGLVGGNKPRKTFMECLRGKLGS